MTNSVYVIILAWNHSADTIECLDFVTRTKYSNIHIVVVDNASTDGTSQIIHHKYPGVTTLVNQTNLGYAEGNNVGIRYALLNKADYIFVLNNDTVIESRTIALLVADLEKNPNAIAACPKSYFYHQPDKIYFAGGIFTPKGAAWHFRKEVKGDGGYVTEWLNGCALMLRARYLNSVGLFDPSFFLLFEDVDWSFRARKKGYVLRIVPASKILHKASASFDGPKSPDLMYYYTRNYFLFYKRNFSLFKRMFLYANRTIEDACTIKNLIKILLAYTPQHRAIRRAYLDFCLRRFHQRKYEW